MVLWERGIRQAGGGPGEGQGMLGLETTCSIRGVCICVQQLTISSVYSIDASN